MTAAEAIFPRLKSSTAAGAEITDYPEALKRTWLWDELYRVRNVRPAFRAGTLGGLVYAAIDTEMMMSRMRTVGSGARRSSFGTRSLKAGA